MIFMLLKLCFLRFLLPWKHEFWLGCFCWTHYVKEVVVFFYLFVWPFLFFFSFFLGVVIYVLVCLTCEESGCFMYLFVWNACVFFLFHFFPFFSFSLWCNFRYLELQRITEKLSLFMIMYLSSPLSMSTYGFAITRLVTVLGPTIHHDLNLIMVKSGVRHSWGLRIAAVASIINDMMMHIHMKLEVFHLS